jgi:hypothetical protein
MWQPSTVADDIVSYLNDAADAFMYHGESPIQDPPFGRWRQTLGACKAAECGAAGQPRLTRLLLLYRLVYMKWSNRLSIRLKIWVRNRAPLLEMGSVGAQTRDRQ